MPTDSPIDVESTASLLARVRAGDAQARDDLLRRYFLVLSRWAHGRLPARARDLVDTDDLVQITLLQALKRVEQFEPRKEGAFIAYLHRILVNRIRDEIRSAARKPGRVELPDEIDAESPSPLEEAIGREAFSAYEKALARLSEEQREAIIIRVELGFTHRQLAEALGYPSPDAARMVVARGLVRLAELMNERA